MDTNDLDEDFRFRLQFQRELLEKSTRVQRSDRDSWQRSELDLGSQGIELFAWMSPFLIPVARCTVSAYGILSCFRCYVEWKYSETHFSTKRDRVNETLCWQLSAHLTSLWTAASTM